MRTYCKVWTIQASYICEYEFADTKPADGEMTDNADEKDKRESKATQRELTTAEERIKILDKIIQSLYEE